MTSEKLTCRRHGDRGANVSCFGLNNSQLLPFPNAWRMRETRGPRRSPTSPSLSILHPTMRHHLTTSSPALPHPAVDSRFPGIQPTAHSRDKGGTRTPLLLAATARRHQRRRAQPEEKTLQGYQALCHEVGIDPSDSIAECKRYLRNKPVNIIDLIDTRRTGKRVEV